MNSTYRTNLTEQQYKSQEGRLVSFSKRLRQRIENKEVSLDKMKELVTSYAKKLGLIIIYEKENSFPKIVRSEEIFDSKGKEKIRTRFEEKQLYEKTPELEIPRQFYTSGERDDPCQIVKNPNVKNIMAGAINYTNQVGREVHYTLCDTPSGIKVSSPSFGSRGQLSRRTERSLNKCSYEFGKNSNEIGEFHTHPRINSSEFSVADITKLVWKDEPENINDSRCVVAKVRNKKGEEKIRARCTTSRDTTRYLNSIKYKGMERHKYGLPDILYSEEALNKLEYKFGRDPDMQNAFTCTVDINGSKPTRNKPHKSNYSSEYDGKIISRERIKSTKKQEKIAKKTQRKIFKKSSSEQSSGFLGLGNFI